MLFSSIPFANFKSSLDHDATRRAVKFASLSFLLIAICMTIFLLVASHLPIKPLNFVAPDASPNDAAITFTTELVSADATARTIIMDWYPTITSECSLSSSLVADIYLDPDLLDSSSPSFSSIPPIRPAYQFNASAFCGNGPLSGSIFRTVSRLLTSQFDLQSSPLRSTLQNYPFDVYYARFSIYALDNETGAYIPLNVTHSFGVAVNFEVSLEKSLILNAVRPQLQIYLRVGRSKAAKAFVIIVAITDWLVAITFVIITAAALVYKNHKIFCEMFPVPIGALFAFTAVRANLPGAPFGFGATIDVFTILPVLVIMAISSFVLMLIILYRRLRGNESGGKNERVKRGDEDGNGKRESIKCRPAGEVRAKSKQGAFVIRRASTALAYPIHRSKALWPRRQRKIAIAPAKTEVQLGLRGQNDSDPSCEEFGSEEV